MLNVYDYILDPSIVTIARDTSQSFNRARLAGIESFVNTLYATHDLSFVDTLLKNTPLDALLQNLNDRMWSAGTISVKE